MDNVYIEKCNSYNSEEVNLAVKNLLTSACIGEVVRNKKILLQPNVLAGFPPERCITTHPAILEALIIHLKNYNVRLIVGDTPFSDDVKSAFRICGLYDVCKRQNVPLVNLAPGKYYEFTDYRVLKGIKMSKYLQEIDMLINLPKAKCHRQMYFTGAVKGVFSLVTGYRKGLLHLKSGTDDNLGEVILDIFNFVKPRFSMFDAIYGLEGNGPGAGGNQIFAGFISCSYAPISLDYVTIKLLGLNPNKSALLRSAKRRNQLDEKNIEIIGDITGINPRFREPMMISVDVMPKFIGRFRKMLSNLEEVVIEYSHPQN